MPSATAFVEVSSPDTRLTLRMRAESGRLCWSLERDQQALIEPATVAISFANQSHDPSGEAAFDEGLVIVSVTSPRLDRFARTLPAGKQRVMAAEATTQTLTLANAAGQQIAIDIVVFDDAAAHRFRQIDTFTDVGHDATGFMFDPATRAFVQPYDRVTSHQPASEALYDGPVPAGFTRPVPEGWSLPALFETPAGWALITQTDVDEWSDGSRLVNEPGQPGYRLAPPPVDQHEGGEPAEPAGPRTLPWKLVIAPGDLGGIVASNATELLAGPSRVSDAAWVRPGRVSWSWWSDSASPRNPVALRRFIDFAAEVGWEYTLIDANWNQMPHGTIEALVAEAADRGVGVFLWYNSGGAHNTVTEEPRDRLNRRRRRRAEMAWLASTGVAGLKVDFFHSDRASMNRLAFEMLADAAEFGLLMNFHGITSPKGWHATWPHLLTTEAVRGAEQYKFDPWFPHTAAKLNTILAFTRNVVGPMDYTPMTLSDVDFAHHTTNAHELALGVLFASGLQHGADDPDAYRALGEPGLDFLAGLPVAWDEVRLLDGRPGEHVVLARRHCDRWWIAGINGTDAPITTTIDLARLAPGPWRVARDGEHAREVLFDERPASDVSLTIEMARSGGFAVWPRSR